MATQSVDITEQLTADHREVEEIFGKIEALPSGDKQRKVYADRATIELIRHSVAEEAFLYPAVRQEVEGGGSLADKELEDHAKAERIMKDLEGREADDPEFDRLLSQLMGEIRAHIQDEEGNLFPRLRAAVSQETLADLGVKADRAKKAAPTRPHPSAPDKPPANKLLAPGAGLVDRIRDALSGRGQKS